MASCTCGRLGCNICNLEIRPRSTIGVRPARIISGGQVGADRAGLDVARHLGIPWGGWAPRGYIAEPNYGQHKGLKVQGQIPSVYLAKYNSDGNGLVAADGVEDFVPAVRVAGLYRERTELNVRDSHATLLFFMDREGKGPGSTLTHQLCGQYGKLCQPVAVCSSEGWARIAKDIELVRYFIMEQGLSGKVLNVAGGRESKSPGIYAYTYVILREALR